MEPDGVVIIKGAQGITGTSRDATFTIGIILIADFSVYRPASDSVQRRSCDPCPSAITGLRQSRSASISQNISCWRLTVSAAIAGMAGALYAHNYNSRWQRRVPRIWLQYVHHDSGIRRTRRYRKYPRICHCSSCCCTLLPELLRFLHDLPYADLCSCTDCGYAL